MRTLRTESKRNDSQSEAPNRRPVTGIVETGFDLQEFDRMLEGARQRMRDEEREALVERTRAV